MVGRIHDETTAEYHRYCCSVRMYVVRRSSDMNDVSLILEFWVTFAFLPCSSSRQRVACGTIGPGIFPAAFDFSVIYSM